MSKVRMTLAMVGLVLAFCPLLMATPGDTLRSVPAPHSCPQGLTYDGGSLWNVDRLSDMIYKIDPEGGAVVDSLPAPGYMPLGLTWDGNRLWCVDAEEERIYAIDPATKTVEKTIYCPVSSPTGLAWDGRYLWIADEGGDRIHQISSGDGTTIMSISAPTSHPWGLSFDGTYLWVSDRFADMIYMVTPDRGDVILAVPAPGPHSCGLAWDGQQLWNVDYQTDRIYQIVTDDGTIYARSEEKTEKVDFIHQVRNFGPDSVKTLDVYFALPQNLSNQELIGTVEFSPQVADLVTDKWGQKMAHFHFKNLGPTDFATVRMLASAKMWKTQYFIYPEKVGVLGEIPRDISDRYLIDDAKFDLKNDIIQKAVKEAVGGDTNPYWIARKIFNYLIQKLEYERVGGWNVAPAVLERGNGSCSEYTFVYIAMCRAAGLPARYAGSIVIRNDDASYDDVFHRWVEVYLPGYGWIPVDPSRGDKKWPADQAGSFGSLGNAVLITTVGGGGSEFLDWGYNTNERWTSKGKCKVVLENVAEWTPLEVPSE